MELKKFIIITIFFSLASNAYAELIKPSQKFDPYEVIKIQLEALKNNNKKDEGIRQTWLFAHPDNKKVTGPYDRFKSMIYGQQYKHAINHSSHTTEIEASSSINISREVFANILGGMASFESERSSGNITTTGKIKVLQQLFNSLTTFELFAVIEP